MTQRNRQTTLVFGPPKKRPCHLLALPRELREHILAYLLVIQDHEHPELCLGLRFTGQLYCSVGMRGGPGRHNVPAALRYRFSILFTCTTFYEEGMFVFFRHNVFFLYVSSIGEPKIYEHNRISTSHLRRIRHICLVSPRRCQLRKKPDVVDLTFALLLEFLAQHRPRLRTLCFILECPRTGRLGINLANLPEIDARAQMRSLIPALKTLLRASPIPTVHFVSFEHMLEATLDIYCASQVRKALLYYDDTLPGKWRSHPRSGLFCSIVRVYDIFLLTDGDTSFFKATRPHAHWGGEQWPFNIHYTHSGANSRPSRGYLDDDDLASFGLPRLAHGHMILACLANYPFLYFPGCELVLFGAEDELNEEDKKLDQQTMDHFGLHEIAVDDTLITIFERWVLYDAAVMGDQAKITSYFDCFPRAWM